MSGSDVVISLLRFVHVSLPSSSSDTTRTALGNLGQIGQKVEDMQKLYLWQQQEASYSMLRDFSGRPDSEEGGNDTLDFEPEM